MDPVGEQLRPLPTFDPELVKRCRERQNAMPLMFEWYKHVALLAIDTAHVSERHPAHRTRRALHLAVLRGLLNRCARLMLSTAKLAHDRKCGETVALLMRCVSETAITAHWLARNGEDSSFDTYLAGGLRADLALRDNVQKNIAERHGKPLRIEARMLRSINRVLNASGLSEDVVRSSKRLKLDDLISDLGYTSGLYIAIGRVGSHAVHGTWPDLLFHYLKEDGRGGFEITDNVESVPESNPLCMQALLLLDALRAHVAFILEEGEVLDALIARFDAVQNGVQEADSLGRPLDFTPEPTDSPPPESRKSTVGARKKATRKRSKAAMPRRRGKTKKKRKPTRRARGPRRAARAPGRGPGGRARS